MRKCLKFIVFALTGCSSGLPAHDQSISAKEETVLRGIVEEYETAWNASDQKALSHLLAEDASQYLEKRPPAHGVAEISLNSVAARETERRTRHFRPITVVANGELGYIIGTYAFDNSGIDTGGFVMTIRRDAYGNWRVASILDNSCDATQKTHVVRPFIDYKK
jgi:ketosteroid isomerase-like protein